MFMNICIDCENCNTCAYVHDGIIIAGLQVDPNDSHVVEKCEDYKKEYIRLTTEKLINVLNVSRPYYYEHLINEPDIIMYMLKKNGYKVRYDIEGTARKYISWYVKRAG